MVINVVFELVKRVDFADLVMNVMWYVYLAVWKNLDQKLVVWVMSNEVSQWEGYLMVRKQLVCCKRNIEKNDRHYQLC